MNKNLSFKQRLHNALGSQEVENVKATHAYLHAMNHSAEEWDTIWEDVYKRQVWTPDPPHPCSHL